MRSPGNQRLLAVLPSLHGRIYSYSLLAGFRGLGFRGSLYTSDDHDFGGCSSTGTGASARTGTVPVPLQYQCFIHITNLSYDVCIFPTS